jgi:hypothetical protein
MQIHRLQIEVYSPVGKVKHYGATTFVGEDKNGVFTDEEAPKKSLTDALTKALSMWGFSADVFLGLYDDNKYVASLTPADPLNDAMMLLLTDHKDEVKSLPNCGTIDEAKRTVHGILKAHLKEWKEKWGDEITAEQIVELATNFIKSKKEEDFV